MGVEKNFADTFAQYKKDEETLEKRIVEQFSLKISYLFSGVWIGHMVAIFYGFMKLIQYLDTVDPSKAAPALVAVFGGALILGWLIWGSYLWFHGTDDMREGWVSVLSYEVAQGYGRAREIRKLKSDHIKREEFFKFYELYQNDENFRASYNAQVSKKAESDEFLEKLNK